jgi:hypothetical protein
VAEAFGKADHATTAPHPYSTISGRRLLGQSFLGVAAGLVGCAHLFGLLRFYA